MTQTKETSKLILIDRETTILIQKVVRLTGWSPLKTVKIALRSYVWLRKHVGKAVVLTPSDLLQLLTGKDVERG